MYRLREICAGGWDSRNLSEKFAKQIRVMEGGAAVGAEMDADNVMIHEVIRECKTASLTPISEFPREAP